MKSIQKGKRFEREIVKLLERTTHAKWHRVPQSGAMATTKSIGDTKFKADVFSEEEPFNRWVVECKVSKETITLADLFNPKSRIWKWWEQAINQTPPGHVPVLFFKHNNSRYIYMAIRDEDDLLIANYVCDEEEPITVKILGEPVLIYAIIPKRQ